MGQDQDEELTVALDTQVMTKPGEPHPDDRVAVIEKGVAVGRYLVIEQIGSGGMGVVYSAYDPQLDRKIALKFLHHRFVAAEVDGVGQARLLSEARSLAKLAHPNVVTIHDAGLYDGRIFLATEFLAGPTLHELRKAGESEWSKVLSLYQQAGRGLAAAHRAGLVHRDFKPGNVMLDDHGRAKVMDFGLAKALQETSFSEDGEDQGVEEWQSEEIWSSPQTYSGLVMGTPAYMSPEQIEQQPATERSDQYSFAVALFECLYGVRPFRAKTPGRMLARIREGAATHIPTDSKVPAHIREVILRGLSFDPEQRFADMDAMMAALEPKTSRALPIKYAVIAALVIGTAVYTLLQTPVEPCQFEEERVAQVWSGAARTRTQAAFLSSGQPFAGESFATVDAAIRGYLGQWTDHRLAACRATRVLGNQSEELMDLRMLCLDQRMDSVQALVEVLRSADSGVVGRAVRAATELPAIGSCSTPQSLMQRVKMPDDPSLLAQIRSQQRGLAAAKANFDAGKYSDSRQILQGLEVEGVAEYAPLVASFHFRTGRALERLSDLSGAEHHLEQAVFWATRGRDYAVAARAAAAMANVVGYLGEEVTPGTEWIDRGESLLSEVEEPLLEAHLLSVAASIYQLDSNHDAELAASQRVLALRRKHLPAGDIHVGMALNNLGNAWRYQGKVERAMPYYKEAQKVFSDAYGRSHPLNAILLGNMGGAYQEQGLLEEASTVLEEALSVAISAFGESHQETAAVLVDLSVLHKSRDNYALCLEYARRATYAIEQSAGADNPNVLEGIAMEASCLLSAGNYEEAGVRAEEGLGRIPEPLSGKLERAQLLLYHAEALIGKSQEPQRARRDLEQALPLAVAAGVYAESTRERIETLLKEL